MSTALSAAMPSPKPLFPPLTRDLAVTSLIAGIAADLTWEFWARVITPFLPGVGGPLEPAALVQSVFGLDSRFVAELIHLVVGFVFYPLGYLFVARPLANAILPSLPWWLVAAGFGVGACQGCRGGRGREQTLFEEMIGGRRRRHDFKVLPLQAPVAQPVDAVEARARLDEEDVNRVC